MHTEMHKCTPLIIIVKKNSIVILLLTFFPCIKQEPRHQPGKSVVNTGFLMTKRCVILMPFINRSK